MGPSPDVAATSASFAGLRLPPAKGSPEVCLGFGTFVGFVAEDILSSSQTDSRLLPRQEDA